MKFRKVSDKSLLGIDGSVYKIIDDSGDLYAHIAVKDCKKLVYIKRVLTVTDLRLLSEFIGDNF